LKYAFFTSALFADRGTPNTSYKSRFELEEKKRTGVLLVATLGSFETIVFFNAMHLPSVIGDTYPYFKPPFENGCDIM
jgi:hypothetical protein